MPTAMTTDEAERLAALETQAAQLEGVTGGDALAAFMTALRQEMDRLMAGRRGEVAANALDRLGELSGLAGHPRLRAVVAMMGIQVRLVAGRAQEVAEPVLKVRRAIADLGTTASLVAASLEADLEQAVAAAHEACGAVEQACQALAKAIALRATLVGRQGLPDQRPQLAMSRNALARLLLRAGRPGEAIDVLDDCLDTLALLANEDGGLGPQLFNLRCAVTNRLGRAYAAEGRDGDALVQFRAAVEAMRSLVEAPGGEPFLHDLLHALGDLEAAERKAGNGGVADELQREGVRRHAHHHH